MEDDAVSLNPAELEAIERLLRRGGYTVIARKDLMNIEQLLQEILTAVQALPSADAIATAVVAKLPQGTDLSAAIAAVQQAVSDLAAKEGVDTSSVEQALANVQSTLGDVPAPPASS